MAFDITARLGMDASGFDAGLRGAEGRISSFAASMTARLGALFSIAAISSLTRRVLEYSARVQDMATATGTSAEAIQELDFAMTQNGGTLEDGIKALKELSKARAEALANPTGNKAQIFGNFGITPDVLRNTRDANVLLTLLSDALKGVQLDSEGVRQVLELVGSKNLAVIPTLIDGYRELQAAAFAAGVVIDDNTTGALKRLGDEIAKLQKQLTAGAAPVLAKALEMFQMTTSAIAASGNGLMEAMRFLTAQTRLFFQTGRFSADIPAIAKAFERGALEFVLADKSRSSASPNRRNLIVPDQETPDRAAARDATAAAAARLESERAKLEARLSKQFLAGLSPDKLIKALEFRVGELTGSDILGRLGGLPGNKDLEVRLARGEAEAELAAARKSLAGTADRGPGILNDLAAIGAFGATPGTQEGITLQRDIREATTRSADILARIERLDGAGF